MGFLYLLQLPTTVSYLCNLIFGIKAVFHFVDRGSSGQKFLTVFLSNIVGPQLSIALVSENDKIIYVNISSDWNNFVQTVTLAPKAEQIINIDASFQMIDSNGINNKAILLQSNDNFIAYAYNFAEHSSDSYLLKPIESLDNYYIILGPQFAKYGSGIQFTITAIGDNTSVTITDLQGKDQVKVLNRYQTWSFASAIDNLSGYTVNATKPVAVFSGGSSSVPDPYPVDCCPDTVGDQLVPVTQWGQSYMLVPLLGRTFTSGNPAFDSFFLIVAAFDDTHVTFTGSNSTLMFHLNKTEHIWPFHSQDIGLLTADKPFMVAQLAADGGFAIPTYHGDPFFNLLPPFNSNFNSKYTLLSCFSSFDANGQFLQIVVQANETAGVQLDGAPVPQNTGNWVTIPGTNLATLTTNLKCNGTVRAFALEHQKPQISMRALVYGFSYMNSYGFFGSGYGMISCL